MGISITGVAETIAKFAAIQAVGKVAGDLAERAIAEGVANTAKALVPVDTGELRDSITVTDEGVIAGTDHATFVEFGTYKMAAEPFMRPAADAADAAPGVEAATRAFGGL